MATLQIVVDVNSADGREYSAVGSPGKCLKNAANLLMGIAGGARIGTAYVNVHATSPVAASGTITLVNVSADDTVTIGKTTLTAKASPSGENQFSQAGSDTADAASLVTKINAHSVLSLLVSATSSAGVVTVTSLVKGVVANHIALASSNGTRLAVTGSGYLASGTGGQAVAATQYK